MVTYEYSKDDLIARTGRVSLGRFIDCGERFINEPHVGGGNPVISSKGTSYFNDMLGTTLGAKGKYKKYSAAALTAFGERLDNADTTSPAIRSLGEGWFTGKPYVAGLGHAFLFRNYRASLAKWQTADPLGYPDGWNQLAYCANEVQSAIDLLGALTVICMSKGKEAQYASDIAVSRSSVGTNEGGTFGAFVTDISGIGGAITIEIELSIRIDYVVRESYAFESDAIAQYAPHTGSNNDSMGRNSVYEAIYDHEKAHATYWLEHQLVAFKSLLNKADIDDGTRSESEIWDLVRAVYDISWNLGAEGSNAAANVATLDWFDRHQEWRPLPPLGDMRRWIKE